MQTNSTSSLSISLTTIIPFLAKKCKDSRQCILKDTKALPKIPRKSKTQDVNEQRQEEFEEEQAEAVVNEGGLKVKKSRKPRKKKE